MQSQLSSLRFATINLLLLWALGARQEDDMAFRGAMRIASCFIGLALAEIWRTTARRLCVLLSQADSERALLGRDHNLVLARQPTDGPVGEGGRLLSPGSSVA